VVLFTDGGSGLDQYPRRAVGDGYPAFDLQGDQLAEMRVEEAREAMSILGVSHYVRLGLENRPYAGVDDVRPTDDVVASWGGEDSLIDGIASLILGYEPDIIVSPEGPSAALEHFEHETVGLLVNKALDKLERENGYTPAGRLVSVDPVQKGLFADAIGVRADGTDSKCGLSYRAVQAAALSKHLTQRDASVVGVEVLSGFDREYYKKLAWKFTVSLEEYLEPR
jgi:LmbE family N-acetylglucosaminyl deacetylase